MQTAPPAALVRARPDGRGARVAAAQRARARERARARGVAAGAAAGRAQRVARRLGAGAETAHRQANPRH